MLTVEKNDIRSLILKTNLILCRVIWVALLTVCAMSHRINTSVTSSCCGVVMFSEFLRTDLPVSPSSGCEEEDDDGSANDSSDWWISPAFSWSQLSKLSVNTADLRGTIVANECACKHHHLWTHSVSFHHKALSINLCTLSLWMNTHRIQRIWRGADGLFHYITLRLEPCAVWWRVQTLHLMLWRWIALQQKIQNKSCRVSSQRVYRRNSFQEREENFAHCEVWENLQNTD